MKQYACLDTNDIVIAVEFLNPAAGDSFENAYAYIQVGPGGVVEEIPSVGQVWDGEAIKFI